MGRIFLKISVGLLISIIVIAIVIIVNNKEIKAAITNLSIDILAGTLSISAPTSATLSQINLDNLPDTGGYSTGTISGVKVKDHRATSPGWSVTMTNSNFVSGTSTVIAVTNLTVTPGTITPVGNSSLTGVTAGSQHTFASETDPATLMSATAGNGRGRYIQDEGLQLFIDISTIPGTYNATSTLTVS